MTKYEVIPTIDIDVKSIIINSDILPEVLHLEDPAIKVMCDFNHKPAHTIPDSTKIDDALHLMKSHHEHLLFVTSNTDSNSMIGIIASEHILGEEPVKITQEKRIPRHKITVDHIMTGMNKMIAFDHKITDQMKIGHVVKTLKAHDVSYALVLRTDEAQHQIISGVYSLSHISRELHIDLL